MIRSTILLGAALLTSAQDSERAVRFIACPVYRDTDAGRKSGCWLATDPATGTRYDVTAAPTKADWNHAILVEGRIAAEQGDPCGGRVLEPVRVSVLDAGCTRHLIKAEGYKGRRFALPARNVRPLYDPRTKPVKPFVEGRFTIPFDYGRSFIVYQLGDYYLDQAITYALDITPATIEIAGSAQRRPEMVSGQSLAEDGALARQRAEVVKRAFVMRGVPAADIRILDALPGPFVPEAFDGLDAPASRRVDIRIRPATSG